MDKISLRAVYPHIPDRFWWISTSPYPSISMTVSANRNLLIREFEPISSNVPLLLSANWQHLIWDYTSREKPQPKHFFSLSRLNQISLSLPSIETDIVLLHFSITFEFQKVLLVFTNFHDRHQWDMIFSSHSFNRIFRSKEHEAFVSFWANNGFRLQSDFQYLNSCNKNTG